jgi:uncharacterized protein
LSPPRKLPVLDGETGFFWTGGRDGRLLIQRCSRCGHWQHPPLPLCPACHGDAVEPQPVSGRGAVKSFTVNQQAWLPGLEQPFVFAAIELVEQAELYVFSNVLAPPDDVHIGLRVAVRFEHQDDVWLPLFEPERADA